MVEIPEHASIEKVELRVRRQFTFRSTTKHRKPKRDQQILEQIKVSLNGFAVHPLSRATEIIDRTLAAEKLAALKNRENASRFRVNASAIPSSRREEPT